MAKPSTTHVIEIETGIGEPAFIPLTLGQELQPISVGKKGMWRIESARVLDVHAFVYFDGTSLFLQSADESAAASVDGYRVGKAWTELHAPCKIEIGAARLRFRSLSAPADDQAATEMHHRPPVQAAAPGGGPAMQAAAPGGGSPMQAAAPGASGPPPVPRPAAGAPPPDPITFPKAERPFKPGEFASITDKDESTRVAPLESTGARLALSGGSVVSSSPRPAAGRSVEEENATRMEGNAGRLNRTGGMQPAPDPTVGMPVQPLPPGMYPGMGGHPPGMMPGMQQGQMQPMQPGMPGMGPGMPMQSGMPPPMSMPPGIPMSGVPMPPGSNPYPQPYAGASGAYNAMGPGSVPSGGFGAMTGGQFGAPPGAHGDGDLLARYKELSPPKRILVVLAPFCLIAAAYLLLFDDDAVPSEPVAALDAGLEGAAVASNGSTSAAPPDSVPPPVVPPPVASPAPIPPACPPGFVPYSVAISGQIPCVPAGTQMPAPSEDTGGAVAGAVTAPAGPGPSAPATAGSKTLERQAVDYVAIGNYGAAAQVYEQLQEQNPKNPVYPEAVRILRAKLDAGLP